MDSIEVTALVTKASTSFRWECEDCKRKGLWFSENQEPTTTNNGTRHAEKFGHTTYMVSRVWGFTPLPDSGYLASEPVRL